VADQLRYASPRGRRVLAATVLGSALASVDATIVGIALPAIGRDLDADLTTLQWIVTGYTLTLAGLLLVAGALGDRYGRRRVFVIGVVWFAAASLLCALARDPAALVAARILQGVGAALLTPGSLAILEVSFHPDDRGRAIGAWSGLSGIATAVGPFLGGWAVEVASWPLIFLVNLPLAALVVFVAVRHVPESRDRDTGSRVDVLGGALVTAGLVGLTYGLLEGPVRGWAEPIVPTALAGGIAALIGFVAWERRASAPVLPLELFRSSQFTATNLVTFVLYGALGGALFLLPLFLQQVAGYSPLQAGVSLLPLTAIMLLLSAPSGALAARAGPRWQLSVGPVLVGAGMALFARVGPDGDYVTRVLPAVLVLGFGLAATVAPLTATVLAAAPSRHAGAASAVNNDVARAAGLVAVAVLPAAAGITGAAYLDPVAFSAGFHVAVLICAGLCVLAGVFAAATIRAPVSGPARAVERAAVHCRLDAPPAVTTAVHR
jgi:EmrB/QacA subfamily drug resistance transporter